MSNRGGLMSTRLRNVMRLALGVSRLGVSRGVTGSARLLLLYYIMLCYVMLCSEKMWNGTKLAHGVSKIWKNLTKLWHVNPKNKWNWQSDGGETLQKLWNDTKLVHRLSKIWRIKNLTKLWHVNRNNKWNWQSDGGETLQKLWNDTKLVHRLSKIWRIKNLTKSWREMERS